MTEEEWLTGIDPTPMLKFLLGKVSARKLRLVSCGCCRAVWPLLIDKRSRIAVRKLEEYADNVGNERLRRDAYNTANAAYMSSLSSALPWAAACTVVCATDREVPPNLWGNLASALETPDRNDGYQIERRLTICLLRDIFGNPFRPVVADPAWLTPTVVAIAEAIYRDRAFDRLPILADALEEAGCTDADLLLHCRQPGEHVRGCWAVDLVLGKG
jgi:hypothetical protein